MKLRWLASLALATAVAVPWDAGDAGVVSRTSRILVVGDSLSQGFGGDWTWRYWVWQELRRQGVDADFVGPRTLPSNGTRYERTSAWDNAHAAKTGSQIDQHLPLIAREMADYRPDVLVVELGYNDVVHGDDAATVTQQLQQLITLGQLASPTTRVVLAQLTSTQSGTYDEVTADINARMSRWALLHGVTVARNRTGTTAGGAVWNPSVDTFDGLHPNATGQTLLADAFADALRVAGVLPHAPRRLYRQRTWSPDVRPSVTAVPGGARVSWAATSREVYLTQVRVVVDGVTATGWRAVPGSSVITVPLAPGPHRVQLVPRRGTMTGAVGGVVTVTVR